MGKREKAARERRLLTREQLARAAAATEGSGGGAGRGQGGRLEEGLKEVQRVHGPVDPVKCVKRVQCVRVIASLRWKPDE